ncbi:hypothetical protein Sarmat_00139 [Rickettsiales endosymbiont of Paramecium tredecaurelia]|uniref:DUF2793 domain-containing protein n=1 Tax=Candidatus Sarmatiella mevalonica TaxID=2770581 RepID=UPI0019206F08|nr:DUF2793 domain-containing protein [Candidatus Sarmatiella mevalonica]MBL3284299.1 hypothetical protein [Candidatus Sarmatiella mevalonica]
MQHNRDVLLNENLVVLDALTNIAITDFLEHEQNAVVGKNYILKKNNCLYYHHSPKNAWRTLEPQEGMYFFFLASKSFVYYSAKQWHVLG